jgi:hypothetical protein
MDRSKPKILILVMSCNKPFFSHATKVITDTWIKDVNNYNIDYYIYSGGYSTQKIDNHYIECASGDDLDSTFDKTKEVLELSNAKKYDYVIRTNTSTYINIRALNKFLCDKFVSKNRNKTVCGDISILNDRIQLRGNSLILTNADISRILDFKIENLPKDIENTHDDVVISYIWESNFDKNIDRTRIIKDNVDFTPCVYFNDRYRVGHPLAIFDTTYNNVPVTNKYDVICATSIFIAYRKNNDDRYSELGEAYKIYDILHNLYAESYVKLTKIPVYVYKIGNFEIIDLEK